MANGEIARFEHFLFFRMFSKVICCRGVNLCDFTTINDPDQYALLSFKQPFPTYNKSAADDFEKISQKHD